MISILVFFLPLQCSDLLTSLLCIHIQIYICLLVSRIDFMHCNLPFPIFSFLFPTYLPTYFKIHPNKHPGQRHPPILLLPVRLTSSPLAWWGYRFDMERIPKDPLDLSSYHAHSSLHLFMLLCLPARTSYEFQFSRYSDFMMLFFHTRCMRSNLYRVFFQ